MPSVWRTIFQTLSYSVQRRGLWICPDKDLWCINQVENNGVDTKGRTRGWMGHMYNNFLLFVRPAGSPQHWSGFPALLLHLRELFPGQPWLLEDNSQLSVLLKLLCEAFALLFLKAGQSCCFTSLYYTISSSGLYLKLQFLWLIPLSAIFWLQPVVLQPFESTMAQTYMIIH